MGYTPHTSTVVAILAFFVAYSAYMVRKTLRGEIDIADLALLAAVGIVPAIFVVAPAWVVQAARFLGVAFPFVLLFGGLFVVVFLGLYRLIVQIHRANARTVALVQELGLLRARLEEFERRDAHDGA